MSGVSKLMATAEVRYRGAATGPLYTREQVAALVTTAARRAACQTALRVAKDAEDLLAHSDETEAFAASVRAVAGMMSDDVDVSV